MKSDKNKSSMKMIDEANLPHNYQDLLLKNLTDNHPESLLEILQVDVKGIKPIGNEANQILTSQVVFDRAFVCPDGSMLDLEFDSTGKEADLMRYAEYAFLLFLNNYKQNKIIAAVTVIAIYPAGVAIPQQNELLVGNRIFTIQQKSLARLVNGQELLKNFQDLVSQGVNPFQSSENVVKFPLAILGQEKEDRLSYYQEGLKLAKPFSDNEKAKNVVAWMTMAASQTLKMDDIRLILKEFNMGNMIQFADELTGGHISHIEAENAKLVAEAENAKLVAEAENAKLVAEVKITKLEAEAEIAKLRAELERAKADRLSHS
jgi:hypothetical protein